MKKIKRLTLCRIIVIALLFTTVKLAGQTMPAVMDTGTIREQKSYLEEKINIYNGYRAVRDDIFLKSLKNNLDSLNTAKSEIGNLEELVGRKDNEIQNLTNNLNTTKEELDLAIKNRDSLVFLGIPMAKTLYNMILWGIILGLAAILVFGILFYRRNRNTTLETRNDLEETRKEFEEFRRVSREKSEQMVINHFNEIKKLKEGR